MVHPKILITGASGFVGRNLVEYIVREGSGKVIAALRNPEAADWIQQLDCEVVQLDLCDTQNLRAVLKTYQPDYIINCAAYGVNPTDRDPGRAFQINVQMPIEILRTSAEIGVKRFVQIGSCSEYGKVGGRINENQPLDPIGIYATTKAAASLLLLGAAAAANMDVVVLRLFNMWGKFELPHRLVQKIALSGKENRMIDLSEGCQIRDFSFAQEVVWAISKLTLYEQSLPHQVFNIGTGDGITVREFATVVARELKVDHLLNFGAVPMRTDEVSSHIADVTRLRGVLGDTPKRINNKQISSLFSSVKCTSK